MTQPFENCRLAHPYWLSTIRAVQLPTLTSSDIPESVREDFAVVIQSIQSGALLAAGTAVERVRSVVGRETPAAEFLAIAASLIRLQAGDLPGARGLLDEAALTRPRSAAVHQARGVVRLRLEDHAGAVESFTTCVSLDPDRGEVWAALAVINALERNHSATEQAARQALRLGSQQHGLVPLALMQATYLQGKPVEGAMDFSSLEEPGEARVAEWLAGFPAVNTAEMVHRHGRPVYFVYADHNYVIEHAIPLLLSLGELGTHAAVHLHVANPGPGLGVILSRLREAMGTVPLHVSTETVPVEQYAAPSIYHSCIRFVRMYQLCMASDSPVIMLDADTLVRRNPVPLVAGPPTDVVVSRSMHDPLWSMCFGWYLQIQPTPRARAYLAQVAAFILDNLRKGTARWFLDQTALSVCFGRSSQKVQFSELPLDAASTRDYSGTEYFWTAVNEDKHGDNAHTREKHRLRATYGFEPEALERMARSEPIRAGDSRPAVRQAEHGSAPSTQFPTWSPWHDLAVASRDFLQARLERREDAAAALEAVHFHLVMAFAYSAQFKLYDVCRGQVIDGPFRGMRFPPPRPAAALADLVPVAGGAFNIAGLLLGSYESELHAAIDTLLATTRYHMVVDVGCSLGYYAVGIALRQPAARVHARDTNPAMLAHVRDLATLNGVESRVSVGGIWQAGDFRALQGLRGLVFCDIEGAELELLDPLAAPELLDCDIIVEMHDVFDPRISRILQDRFRESHQIEIVTNNGPRPALPPEAAVLTRHERSALLADLRLGPTPWAIMTPRRRHEKAK